MAKKKAKPSKQISAEANALRRIMADMALPQRGCPAVRGGEHAWHHGYCLEARCALDACAAWLDEPTEERRSAWGVAWLATGVEWLPGPDDGVPPAMALMRTQRVHAAARLAGPEAVRAGVSSALVAWAIGSGA